jgi:ATP-dependent Clp endopeptidase proteolytic subunit ClpP
MIDDQKNLQGAGMIQNHRNGKNAEAVARFWGKSLDKPDWYSVKGLTEDEGEVMIYDIIGWPYNDATELVRAIRGFTGKSLLVRINSPGGDVFDGTAIFNALANHSAKVTTRVEGVAASMASVLAMAGKEVQAYSNTMMMIHDPWVIAMGNQYDLREIADLLEKIGGNLMDIYTGKTKTGKKEMKQMMADETWMTAKEAEEKGFVDTVLTSGKAAKAQFDLSMYANAPDGFSGVKTGRDLTEREIERALRDAGASRNFARAVAVGRSDGDSGDQRDAENQRLQHVDGIRAELTRIISKVRR